MTPLPGDKTTEAAAEFSRHPLLEFVGDLVDINERIQPRRNDPSKTNSIIVFDFANIDVVASNEPYTFPTTQVEIFEMNMPNTQWEAFKASVRQCGYTGDLNGLIGKRMTFKWAAANLSNKNQVTGKYEVKEASCWQVTAIEGVENTSGQLLEAVVSIADGKDAAAFKSAFLADGNIRSLTGYADMLASVMNNAALDLLVAAGNLTVDGSGIYHKA